MFFIPTINMMALCPVATIVQPLSSKTNNRAKTAELKFSK